MDSQLKQPEHIGVANNLLCEILKFDHRQQIEMLQHIRKEFVMQRQNNQSDMEKELAYRHEELAAHQEGTRIACSEL